MKYLNCFVCISACLLLLILPGCSGGGGSGSSGPGQLSLYLTDAATNSYQAVYVTVDTVQVHLGDSKDDAEEEAGGEWKVVASPGKTYNLMALVNGVLAPLGASGLESGAYTQMRLMLGGAPGAGLNIQGKAHPYPNYIIDSKGAVHELKVPSGYQTGIKLVHSFEIVNGLTLELILDFDAVKSVVQAGNSGKYILKPTIKVIGTVDKSIVEGVVTDRRGDVLSGVLVSAQTSDPAAANPVDRVQVSASTVTNENGAYQLFLEPGAYIIVAYKGGVIDYGDAYGPGCVRLATVADAVYAQDFRLSDRQSGHVFVDMDTGGQIATVSFRQFAICGSSSEEIEVTSMQVSQDARYAIGLPGGTVVPISYTAIAFTDEKTDSATLDVTSGENTTINLDVSGAP